MTPTVLAALALLQSKNGATQMQHVGNPTVIAIALAYFAVIVAVI